MCLVYLFYYNLIIILTIIIKVVILFLNLKFCLEYSSRSRALLQNFTKFHKTRRIDFSSTSIHSICKIDRNAVARKRTENCSHRWTIVRLVVAVTRSCSETLSLINPSSCHVVRHSTYSTDTPLYLRARRREIVRFDVEWLLLPVYSMRR